jgi:AcrR family transcriptional regulator
MAIESSPRKLEIMAHASRLFTARGVANTPMSAIAKEIGLQKSSLYYFFPSKEKLVFSILLDVVEGPVRELERIIDEKRTAPERIIEAMKALGRLFDTNSDAMRLLVRENLDSVLAAQDYRRVRASKRHYTALWRKILEEGQREGSLVAFDDQIVAFGMIGSMNWMYAWLDASGRVTGEEVGKILGQIFVNGLSVPLQPDVAVTHDGIGVLSSQWEH